MGRVVGTIVGIVITFVSWFALGIFGFIIAAVAWPEFGAATRAFNATQAVISDQSMLITRLAIAAAASIIAAFITALTVRDNRIAPLAGGLVLLVFFIPNHIWLWDKFPLWYHLWFLPSLPTLAFLGGKLARS